jgi:hypothetical protein
MQALLPYRFPINWPKICIQRHTISSTREARRVVANWVFSLDYWGAISEKAISQTEKRAKNPIKYDSLGCFLV